MGPVLVLDVFINSEQDHEAKEEPGTAKDEPDSMSAQKGMASFTYSIYLSQKQS